MPSRRDVPNVMVPVEGRVDRNCRPSVSCEASVYRQQADQGF